MTTTVINLYDVEELRTRTSNKKNSISHSTGFREHVSYLRRGIDVHMKGSSEEVIDNVLLVLVDESRRIQASQLNHATHTVYTSQHFTHTDAADVMYLRNIKSLTSFWIVIKDIRLFCILWIEE